MTSAMIKPVFKAAASRNRPPKLVEKWPHGHGIPKSLPQTHAARLLGDLRQITLPTIIGRSAPEPCVREINRVHRNSGALRLGHGSRYIRAVLILNAGAAVIRINAV